MRLMRILFVSNMYPPAAIGGYELGCQDLATYAHKDGHTVRVLTSDFLVESTRDPEQPQLHRSLVLDSNNFPNSSAEISAKNQIVNIHNIRILASHVQSFEPDCVVLFNLHGLGVFSILRYLETCRIRFVSYLMDDYFSDLHTSPGAYGHYRSLLGALEMGPEQSVISMSRRLIREIESKMDFQFKNVSFVPGWADYDPVSATVLDGQNIHPVKLLFASAIEDHKGIFLLLEALAQLPASIRNGYVLRIYGTGQLERLQTEINRQDLGETVSYGGSLTKAEILKIYAQYDFLLLPTWIREPFGFVACEAAVNGCIPILTRGTGASEYLEDGKDSIFIDSSVVSIIDILTRINRMNTQEIVALKENARYISRPKFDRTKILSGLIDHLTGLTPASNPRLNYPEKVAKAFMIALKE